MGRGYVARRFYRRERKDLCSTGINSHEQTRVESLANLTVSVRGWVNHVRYGNTVGLRKAILMGSEEVCQQTDTKRTGILEE